MIANLSVSSSAPNFAESAKASKEKAEDRPHHPWVPLGQFVGRQHQKDDANDWKPVPYRTWHPDRPPTVSLLGRLTSKAYGGKPIPWERASRHIVLHRHVRSLAMEQPGLNGRHRDKNGEISRKHGNTLVRTLRKYMGRHLRKALIPTSNCPTFSQR